MKKIVTTGFLLVFSLLSTQGFAQDKPQMQPSMKEKQGQIQMSEEQMNKHLRSKQTHMLLMHDYANKILSEQDPAKKQKLKDEHLELMKAHHIKMKAKHKKMMQMHQKMMN